MGKVCLVRKAGVLGPDASVDDTDNNVFTLAFEVPDTTCASEAKVIGCAVSRRLAKLVSPDLYDITTGS